jgi:hypothetical protein
VRELGQTPARCGEVAQTFDSGEDAVDHASRGTDVCIGDEGRDVVEIVERWRRPD